MAASDNIQPGSIIEWKAGEPRINTQNLRDGFVFVSMFANGYHVDSYNYKFSSLSQFGIIWNPEGFWSKDLNSNSLDLEGVKVTTDKEDPDTIQGTDVISVDSDDIGTYIQFKAGQEASTNGFKIDGQVYKNGDVYPKGAEMGPPAPGDGTGDTSVNPDAQSATDGTPPNAPTETDVAPSPPAGCGLIYDLELDQSTGDFTITVYDTLSDGRYYKGGGSYLVKVTGGIGPNEEYIEKWGGNATGEEPDKYLKLGLDDLKAGLLNLGQSPGSTDTSAFGKFKGSAILTSGGIDPDSGPNFQWSVKELPSMAPDKFNGCVNGITGQVIIKNPKPKNDPATGANTDGAGATGGDGGQAEQAVPPLEQGQGYNDLNSEQATVDGRPQVAPDDFTALNYTSSPLGLVSNKNYKYNELTDSSGNLFSKSNILISQGGENVMNFSKSIKQRHSNTIYDTSTNNIIEQLKKYPSLSLKWADFAYCRDLGVYPNNRLVVCRRFGSPVGDDLASLGNGPSPVSTLVSWIDDTQNILEFGFGEEWVEAGVSFYELLNEVGQDLGFKFGNLGDIVRGAANLSPMPGASEGLQRKVLASLGLAAAGSSSIIPSGTPNLIKESRQRKLIKEDASGSGLIGKFKIKVKCAWEQKFISGVDPTLVYYDILHTVLSFGGSQAVFYLGKRSSLTGLVPFLDRFAKDPVGVIRQLIQKFKDEISSLIDKIVEQVKKLFDSENPPADKKDEEIPGDPESQEYKDKVAAKEKEAKDAADKAEADRKAAGDKVVGFVTELISSFVDTIVKKYRVRALGIVTSLTGAPSTPWHITVGNPLRPILTSGDMECSEVQVNLGSQLSFNDLPSFIECEFTLSSARNLGIDEIMSKLNGGSIRVVEEAPTFFNISDGSQKTNTGVSGTGSTTPTDASSANNPVGPAISGATPSGLLGSPNATFGGGDPLDPYGINSVAAGGTGPAAPGGVPPDVEIVTEPPGVPYSPEVLDNLATQQGQGVLSPEGAVELASQSKVGNDITSDGQTINPDPNSSESILGKTVPPPPGSGSEISLEPLGEAKESLKNQELATGTPPTEGELALEQKRLKQEKAWNTVKNTPPQVLADLMGTEEGDQLLQDAQEHDKRISREKREKARRQNNVNPANVSPINNDIDFTI